MRTLTLCYSMFQRKARQSTCPKHKCVLVLQSKVLGLQRPLLIVLEKDLGFDIFFRVVNS